MYMIGRIMAFAIRIMTWFGMAAIILMMTQITVDVLGKLLFNAPMPATISMVSNYYMVFVAFIPLALAETRNGHISVEVLTEFLPKRTQYHMYSWILLVSAVVFGLFTYKSWQEAVKTYEVGSFLIEQSIKIVIWPSYFILPVGAGMMTLVLVYRWLVYATGAKSGLGEEPIV